VFNHFNEKDRLRIQLAHQDSLQQAEKIPNHDARQQLQRALQ